MEENINYNAEPVYYCEECNTLLIVHNDDFSLYTCGKCNYFTTIKRDTIYNFLNNQEKLEIINKFKNIKLKRK